MYYNRILRVWDIDILDYFLASAILGSFIASHLKNHSSEKKAMKRLEDSIIKKSRLTTELSRPLSANSEEMKIRKIYNIALGNRGGQLEIFQVDPQLFSNKTFKLAQRIRVLILRLALFLKRRELKGIAKIFFKSGRLFLDLILYQCKINITYSLLPDALGTRVIIITSTIGGAVGFSLSWFSAGVSLAAIPVLTSILLLRSFRQQIMNQIDFLNFKNMLNKMLEDDELKQIIRPVFIADEVPTSTAIEMSPLDLDKNSLPKFNFESDQTLKEFTKARMKNELGLVESPTSEQLKEILKPRNINRKSKLVYFRDLIDEAPESLDKIIDAEIIKEPILLKIKND